MSAPNSTDAASSALYPPPVNPDDPGISPTMISVMWTFTSLATIAICLRFYVRVTILRNIALEDWLMLIAGIFQLAYQSCLTRAYHWGLGMESKNMTYDPQIVHTLKWTLISSMSGVVVAITARVSVSVFLLRIFGSKTWFKWYLIIFTTIQSSLAAATEIVYCVQVSPIEGFWNPLLPARRLDPMIAKLLWMTGQSFFTAADLFYVIFPVIFIWRLNMPLGRKIRLAVLVSMSVFTAVASIMKTTLVQESVGQAEEMQSVAETFIWSNLEQTFIIIMGCIPTLPQLFKQDTTFFRAIRSPLQYFTSKGSSVYQRTGEPMHIGNGDRAGYYNLDRPNATKLGLLPPSSAEQSKPGRSTACFNEERDFQGKAGEITRTDQFTLAY
ncbi:hypothetical protein F4781DRAFT_431804 [Annulohypoxylon bovei var. microspora]|nr:hypothetical protein F4781DRAFT_431804 [Annulohypoxylon bovei var. microspora]